MKISIVIICYNGEREIARCLSSAVASVNRDRDEIVVVDDCSTDNTLNILMEWAHRHPCIKLVLNEENLGRAASRNRGLAAATGDYFFYLDADDLISPIYFERAVELLSAHNPDILVCGRMDFGRETQEVYRHSITDRLFSALIELDDATHFPACMSDNFVTGKFIRTRFAMDCGLGFNETRRNAEDIMFSAKLYLEARAIRFDHAPLYLYARGNYHSNFGKEKCIDVLVNNAKLSTLLNDQSTGLAAEFIGNKQATIGLETVRRAQQTLTAGQVINLFAEHFAAPTAASLGALRFCDGTTRKFLQRCKERQFNDAVLAVYRSNT